MVAEADMVDVDAVEVDAADLDSVDDVVAAEVGFDPFEHAVVVTASSPIPTADSTMWIRICLLQGRVAAEMPLIRANQPAVTSA